MPTPFLIYLVAFGIGRDPKEKGGRGTRTSEMADVNVTEELEPLFDYSRVQPHNFVCIDDDDEDEKPLALSPKRRKISNSNVGKKVEEDKKGISVVNIEDEEDWLPPPPMVPADVKNHVIEDSTIRELRLKKQELASFAKSTKDVLRAMEESAEREVVGSLQASLDAVAEEPPKPPCERAKIVISVQDKEGLKQFRTYIDDKFERLFKMYADKVHLDTENLVFSFDGGKVGPSDTSCQPWHGG